MPAPHKHAALIKAWADGAQIEFKDSTGSWVPVFENSPSWNELTRYRVKPAEPLAVSILCGGATLPNGETVDLVAIQRTLCNAFAGLGDQEYADAADQIARLTGVVIGGQGVPEPLQSAD